MGHVDCCRKLTVVVVSIVRTIFAPACRVAALLSFEAEKMLGSNSQGQIDSKTDG
jgi:hypothetical protein